MKPIKFSGILFFYCFLLCSLYFNARCTKEPEITSLKQSGANEGVCIYPVNSKLVISPNDKDFMNINELAERPYIKYNDILTYDTINHVITLNFPKYELFKQIDISNPIFAVTLNRKTLYIGSFENKSVNSVSDKVVIFVNDESGTLSSNQIMIQSSSATNSDVSSDPRYHPELNKRLKEDNKACGKRE